MNINELTVNILSYNRKEYLHECVTSILLQTIKPIKINIFDNGSNKEVYEYIKPLICENTNWIGSDQNNGPFWNFNRSLKYINTEYAIFLHDDDRLPLNFLEKQLTFINSNIINNYSVITSNGMFITSNGDCTNNFIFNNHKGCQNFHSKCDVVKQYTTSCIPISPAIFNLKIFKTIFWNQNYGKCSDVKTFLDAIDFGQILINYDIYYECRIHEGQDSTFFPIRDINKIYNLYYKIAKDSSDSELLNQIKQTYTNIILSRIKSRIVKNDKKFDIFSSLTGFTKIFFSYRSALQLIINLKKNK